jgi:hypothetical protein
MPPHQGFESSLIARLDKAAEQRRVRLDRVVAKHDSAKVPNNFVGVEVRHATPSRLLLLYSGFDGGLVQKSERNPFLTVGVWQERPEQSSRSVHPGKQGSGS